jgi:hypothetical protein
VAHENVTLSTHFCPSEVSNGGGGLARGGQGVRAMADVSDFREEARGCLQLAQAERHPEVRTILMGMVLGWLTLENQKTRSPDLQHAPAVDV